MRTKKLFEIIPNDAEIELIGSLDQVVSKVAIDSRKVSESTLFVAIKGMLVDGHDYISRAIAAGADAVLCEELPGDLVDGVTYMKVYSTRRLVGSVAHAFYDYPSEKLKLVGVTGTNGKTTITTLLYQLFSQLGYVVGLVSTVENRIASRVIPSTHTTPDPIALNALLAEMLGEGCTHVFMEVSSHAIDQGRIGGLDYDVAVFTNLSHDHLDYHGSFKEYIWTKKRLFDDLDRSAIAIVNTDDKHGGVMLQNCNARAVTYGLRKLADVKAKVLSDTVDGLHLNVDGDEVYFRLSGRFNAYNLLAVLATAEALDEDRPTVLTRMSGLRGAEGRLEKVMSDDGRRVAYVDYAHTPDALENVIRTLQKVKADAAQLIVVVGAGGDRDKAKRPKMAAIAAREADVVILTSDNPRSEDPDDILDDMEAGLDDELRKKSIRNADRKSAIHAAVQMARPQDLILVAGKGHETYQEIKGEKLPFDDRKILQAALEAVD